MAGDARQSGDRRPPSGLEAVSALIRPAGRSAAGRPGSDAQGTGDASVGTRSAIGLRAGSVRTTIGVGPNRLTASGPPSPSASRCRPSDQAGSGPLGGGAPRPAVARAARVGHQPQAERGNEHRVHIAPIGCVAPAQLAGGIAQRAIAARRAQVVAGGRVTHLGDGAERKTQEEPAARRRCANAYSGSARGPADRAPPARTAPPACSCSAARPPSRAGG